MKLKATVLALGVIASSNVLAAPVQWAGNGNWYEFISTAVTAPDAFIAAQASTFNGLQGYLVTVTSAEENDFVANLANGQLAWLGGSDNDNPVNDWTWRNGTENGQAFTYTNWWTGEPNDCCGGENYVHINWGSLGFWNDHGGPGNAFQINGYVVEYSAVPVPAAAPMMLSGVAALYGLFGRRKVAI